MRSEARVDSEAPRARRASGPRRRSSAALDGVPEPVTTLAGPTPRKRTRLRRMPRWLRIFFTGSAFAIFFAGTSMLGILAGPWFVLRRGGRESRRRFMRKLNESLRIFAGFMRDLGLIDYWPPSLPQEYEQRPVLLIANHPTLIDVVLLLASLPQLSCVVKASWYRSFVMGPMLRRTEYVPGPGHVGDDGADDESPVVARIEEKLREGFSVLVFPEGTRSTATSLRRFRRGAIEAAIRAEVPILPLFIATDHAFLMKGQPFYDVPSSTAGYVFEWLPPIETAGRDLDSREVTRTLFGQYEARFARACRERVD